VKTLKPEDGWLVFAAENPTEGYRLGRIHGMIDSWGINGASVRTKADGKVELYVSTEFVAYALEFFSKRPWYERQNFEAKP
jgi:hypothetical protein